MTDIDISKIKLGDIVKASICTSSMHAAGVKPTEFEAEVYSGPPYAGRCVAGWSLTNDSITILEHTPARPEWVGAQVIRVNEADGEAFGVLRIHGDYLFPGGLVCSVEQLVLDDAEITVVLDKDGNPPKPEEPEIEWLNEEDLNKLPPCSVVKPRVLSRPRTKGFDGKWYAGESLVDTSPYITPARVIYIPEES